jgi:hypothetical protein
LNNIFSLTAIGVYNGDFMKFEPRVSAVTLAGGRTYYRLLPAHEGQHAICWFIHDPAGMFTKGMELDIPRSWINSTLTGLQTVNPFIDKLENLAKIHNDNDNIVLQIEYSVTDLVLGHLGIYSNLLELQHAIMYFITLRRHLTRAIAGLSS